MFPKLLKICALALTSLMMALPAKAAWPERPITMVVPWPAGANSDTLARKLAGLLKDELGTTVVVQNRTGAAGNVGAEYALQAAPDGYTWFLGSMSHILGAALASHNKHLPMRYDIVEDFVHISPVSATVLVAVVNAKVKANTLQEFITLAKNTKPPLKVSSSGVGSSQHLIAEVLQRSAGIELLHVPYRGIAPSVQDLVGGVVDVSIESIGSVMPHIKEGRLRALAVASANRVPTLPDVPTMAELGYPDVVMAGPQFLSAPKGTPPEVVARISQALGRILQDPKIQKEILDLNIFPLYSTPEETAKVIRSERDKWSEIVRTADIRVE